MEKVDLNKQFRIMSLNHDENNLEFVSTIEDRKYPFYGIQFHPEKNIYEWLDTEKVPHGRNAILVSQYLGNFFIDEGNKLSNFQLNLFFKL